MQRMISFAGLHIIKLGKKENMLSLLLLMVTLLTPVYASAQSTGGEPPVTAQSEQGAVVQYRNLMNTELYWYDGTGIRFLHSPDGEEQYQYKWSFDNSVERLKKLSFRDGVFKTSEYQREIIFPQAQGVCSMVFSFSDAQQRFASLASIDFVIDDGHTVRVFSTRNKELLDVLSRNVEYEGNIIQVVYDGSDTVSMLLDTRMRANTLLLVYSISKDAVVLSQDSTIDRIAPYKANGILIQRGDSIYAYSLDASFEEKIIASGVDADSPFSYGSKDEILYYIKNGDVYRKRIDGEDELIIVSPSYQWSYGESLSLALARVQKEPPLGLLALPDGWLAYHYKGTLYLSKPTPFRGGAKALTFNGRRSDSLVHQFYSVLNPHVSILYLPSDQNIAFNGERAAKVDIYECRTDEVDLKRLGKTGLAYDLSSAGVDAAQLSQYIPEVQKLLTDQGHVVALPVGFKIAPWYVNLAEWERLGLPDPPETAIELMQLAHVWANDYARQNPDIAFFGEHDYVDTGARVMYMLHKQYMMEYLQENERLRFDTDIFHDLARQSAALPNLSWWEPEEPCLFVGHAYGYKNFFTISEIGRTVLVDRESPTEYDDSLGNDFIPIVPVSINGENTAQIGAIMNVLIVNKDAPNLEQALDYVHFVAMYPALGQPDLPFMLSPTSHDLELPRQDVVSFYKEHVDQLSFDLFGLGGWSQEPEVSTEFQKAYWNKPEAAQSEALIWKLIEELNRMAGWRGSGW